MPCDYSKYPPNWPAIRERILLRAGYRCEWPGCGARNGWWAIWVSAENRLFRRPTWKPAPGLRVTRIVLTIAHKDYNPTNNADDNLAAWCQYHHLLWDRDLHTHHARETRCRKREQAVTAQLQLFEE
jgi:hypothetical protein